MNHDSWERRMERLTRRAERRAEWANRLAERRAERWQRRAERRERMRESLGEGLGSGARIVGVILMIAGVALTLANVGVLEIEGPDFWQVIGPLIVLGIGVVRAVQAVHDGSWTSRRWPQAAFMLSLGAWLFLNQAHVLHYRTSWPLLLIPVGLIMAWRALIDGRNGQANGN